MKTKQKRLTEKNAEKEKERTEYKTGTQKE